MKVLVIAEHNNESLSPATLNTLGAAAQLNADIDLLIAGHNCQALSEAATKVSGVHSILLADADVYAHQLAEDIAPLVAKQAPNYSHILVPASSRGKDLIPRLAALIDAQPLSDIIAIQSADTFQRPIYAGNIIATVKSNDTIKLLTVRTTAFDPLAAQGGSASVQKLDAAAASGLSSFDSQELAVSDRPELTAASVVISGGRGLQNAENFTLLYQLADKLNAAVGASRAAVDAGYVANDLQVGQTGKVVAPDLYIAVGISGAIQHLAGMKESKVIVAINKDEDAPIFQVADYGLVADLFDAVPQLVEKL